MLNGKPLESLMHNEKQNIKHFFRNDNITHFPLLPYNLNSRAQNPDKYVRYKNPRSLMQFVNVMRFDAIWCNASFEKTLTLIKLSWYTYRKILPLHLLPPDISTGDTDVSHSHSHSLAPHSNPISLLTKPPSSYSPTTSPILPSHLRATPLSPSFLCYFPPQPLLLLPPLPLKSPPQPRPPPQRIQCLNNPHPPHPAQRRSRSRWRIPIAIRIN